MHPSPRTVAFDGLRGVSAVFVLVSHSVLMFPAAGSVISGSWRSDDPFVQTFLVDPVRLLWAGAEPVIVFFVLSGVVLTRSALRPGFDWAGYVPSRLIRLYLPVAAAILVTLLVVMVVPRDPSDPNPWLARSAPRTGRLVQDFLLITGSSDFVAPLWSLQWEVLFSLLLAVFVIAFRMLPAWLCGLACLVLATAGTALAIPGLRFLPAFGVGVALALEWDRLRLLACRIPWRARRAAGAGAIAAGVLAMCAPVPLGFVLPPQAAIPLAQAPVLLGAALLVFAASEVPGLERALSARPLVALGGWSFSLYLVHETFLLAAAALIPWPWLALAVAVPICFAVAWLFSVLVEAPSSRLARWVRQATPGLLAGRISAPRHSVRTPERV